MRSPITRAKLHTSVHASHIPTRTQSHIHIRPRGRTAEPWPSLDVGKRVRKNRTVVAPTAVLPHPTTPPPPRVPGVTPPPPHPRAASRPSRTAPSGTPTRGDRFARPSGGWRRRCRPPSPPLHPTTRPWRPVDPVPADGPRARASTAVAASYPAGRGGSGWRAYAAPPPQKKNQPTDENRALLAGGGRHKKRARRRRAFSLCFGLRLPSHTVSTASRVRRILACERRFFSNSSRCFFSLFSANPHFRSLAQLGSISFFFAEKLISRFDLPYDRVRPTSRLTRRYRRDIFEFGRLFSSLMSQKRQYRGSHVPAEWISRIIYLISQQTNAADVRT